MTIDGRLEAPPMSGELMMRDLETLRSSVETLRSVVEEDSKNIRPLARIAEIHEHRLTDLEGDAGS